MITTPWRSTVRSEKWAHHILRLEDEPFVYCQRVRNRSREEPQLQEVTRMPYHWSFLRVMQMLRSFRLTIKTMQTIKSNVLEDVNRWRETESALIIFQIFFVVLINSISLMQSTGAKTSIATEKKIFFLIRKINEKVVKKNLLWLPESMYGLL